MIKMKRNHQRGFLLIAAIVLIVVVGLVGAAINHMLSSASLADVNYMRAMQAYYVADSGLNQAQYRMYAPTVSARGDCSSGSITDFATGQFRLYDGDLYDAVSTVTTTSGLGISASSSTVPIFSSTGFLSEGQAFIGREMIRYEGVSSSVLTCDPDSPPCLTGVTRGIDGSQALAHPDGAMVSQYACDMKVVGSVPSISEPYGSASFNGRSFLEVGYVVGSRKNNNLTFLRWNKPNLAAVYDDSLRSNTYKTNMRSVSVAGLSNAYACGHKVNNLFALWRWNETLGTWQREGSPAVTYSEYIVNLYGIDATSEQEAWAVGQRGGNPPGGSTQRRWTVLRRYNNSWCALTPSSSCGGKTVPADSNGQTKNLYAVSTVDTTGDGFANMGFAVGQSGTILQYNGTSWTQISSPTSQDLLAVKMVSANEAWASGKSGVVLRWTSAAGWQLQSGTGIGTNDVLQAVTVLDTTGNGYANVGWVGGYNSNRARAYRFVHATPASSISWTAHRPTANDVRNKIFGMAMLRVNDVWASENGRRIVHWDGSAWELAARPSGIGGTLYSIALAGPKNVALQRVREIFN
jgi:type II secretory pathway pseudopilin PulG